VANDNNAAPKTINPVLLDQQQHHPKSKFTFEAPGARRAQPQVASALQDVDPRKPSVGSGDVLYKARDMGMKIWALEKLQRMMHTMFNTDTGEQVPQPQITRAAAGVPTTKLSKEADLQRLLQHEKVNGPADRDPTVATQDMTQFRGYYIYIHDWDEKTRPVMVRDYPKVAKEDGKWPQLRYTGPGRCPFVEDPTAARTKLRERLEAAQTNKVSVDPPPRTRAAVAMDAAQDRVANHTADRQVLGENNNFARRQASTATEAARRAMMKPLDPPPTIPVKRTASTESMPPLFGSAQASLRQLPRYAGGEPVASGVQPSNVTSAIRSQMISSTAAAPGARAGSSKEVNQLKRKILEKNSVPSANSIPSSYMNDVRAAINGDRGPPRAAKRKAQETLGQIHEDSEDELSSKKFVATKRKKQVAEKELKPGYCENCREKFNDFDEVGQPTVSGLTPKLTMASTLHHGSIASSRFPTRTGRSWTTSSNSLIDQGNYNKNLRNH